MYRPPTPTYLKACKIIYICKLSYRGHIYVYEYSFYLIWICPNLTQLMFEYELKFPSMGQEKKIPMALTAKWKHPGYLRPMCYMSDGPFIAMGLLPDTWNFGLLMSRECRERLSRHWLQRKPLVIDPGMYYGTCVTHGPWCMSGSLIHRGGKNVPGIPGACTACNFAYLTRGPLGKDKKQI